MQVLPDIKVTDRLVRDPVYIRVLRYRNKRQVNGRWLPVKLCEYVYAFSDNLVGREIIVVDEGGILGRRRAMWQDIGGKVHAVLVQRICLTFEDFSLSL